MGGGCGVRGMSLNYCPRALGVLQQLIDAVADLFRLVQDEKNFGRAPKLEPLNQFVAHVTLRSLQSRKSLAALGFIFVDQAHENTRGAHVRRHAHFCNRHRPRETRIFQFARQHQAHFIPDFFRNPLDAVPAGAMSPGRHSPSSKYSISLDTRSRPRIRSDSRRNRFEGFFQKFAVA